MIKYSDTTNEADKNALEELKNTKEAIEMELHRSNVIFNSDDNISVKVPSDYLD